jgi:MFS family permease
MDISKPTDSGLAPRRKLPAVVWRLGWVSLFTDVATEMAYPLLPAFLLSIGAGSVTLGVMEGVAESVSALVKWITGRASDGRTRKPFVVAGYGVATLARPLLALATHGWHVVAIRATDRIGKGLRSAPRDALLAGAVAPEERGYAFGFHQMMDNLGAVVGPLLAFALVREGGLSVRTVLGLTVIPGVIAFATVVRVRETPPTRNEVGAVGPVAPAASVEEKSSPAALPSRLRAYLALVALFTLGASADSFLILRLMDLGLDAGLAPLAWISLNGAKALLNMPGGRMSDRFGRRRTQFAGWLVYAAAYALFPLTRSIALTWALLIAYGAYYGLTEGGEKALLVELAPKEARGRAFGVLHAITGAATLPANALFGALYANHASLAFELSAAFAALAAVGLASMSMWAPSAESPSRDRRAPP